MFHRPAVPPLLRGRLAATAVALGLLGSLTTSAWAGARESSPQQPAQVPVTAGSTAGTATPLSGYAIQSSAKVTDSAAAVSSPGYPATGWYPAGARSTVLAALIADGVHPDPFYSTNQQKIPKADFQVPWWYRSDFTVADSTKRTYLDFSGVISAADVYVNGKRIAKAADVTGAYTQHELDVTSLVRSGTNTVAFRIQPNDPNKNLTMGWIDWLQPPPDQNMGIVRDVLVRRGGLVALRDAHVVTKLSVPSLATADLTVKARARNDSDAPVTAKVRGSIGRTTFEKTVSLAAHQTKTVAFSPPMSAASTSPPRRSGGPRAWAAGRSTTSTSPPPSRAPPPTPHTRPSASATSGPR